MSSDLEPVSTLARPPQVVAELYDTVIRTQASSPFLSPCSDPKYVARLCRWLTSDGGQVAEVGPGFGAVVSRVASASSRIQGFTVVDFSSAALRRAALLWTGARCPLNCVHLDLANADAAELEQISARRLVAINVLQDLDLPRGVANLAALLAPGGRMRVTILAKETMDAFYCNSPAYSSAKGVYVQRMLNSVSEQGGRGTCDDDAEMRVLRFGTREEIPDLFATAGCRVYRIGEITYGSSRMLERWRARKTLGDIDPTALGRLKQENRYLDAYEVLARRHP